MTFGERLRSLRNEQDITQTELGKVIKMSKPNISKLENEQIEPNNETLVHLATYFDVTIDYLVGVSNVRKPKGITRFHLKDSMEVKDLPPKALEELENMLDYLREKHKKNKIEK